MDCQLALAAGATERRAAAARAGTWIAKRGARSLDLLRRGLRDPASALRRLAGRALRAAGPARALPGNLGLRPGERVRVRPATELRATLDATGRCRGLALMPEMERFAGRELVVKKRVELFFDERTREMRRLRDVVILEGACCEGRQSDPWDYAGCDRSCFLFWKEAWLERVG
jgi:hypothetical protein